MVNENPKKCNEWPILTEKEVADTFDGGDVGAVWELITEDSIRKLRRTFTAKNFQAALDFINLAGAAAEKRGHHPDFHLTSYRNVTVVIYTHSLKGLTENDFLLATDINACKVLYSPKWLRENSAATFTALEN